VTLTAYTHHSAVKFSQNTEKFTLQVAKYNVSSAVSVVLSAHKSTKIVNGRESARNPAGRAHDAPQTSNRLPLPKPI